MTKISETELVPAEVVPFREYVYDETYFTEGKVVLEGPEIPFDETVVGQHEGDNLDHLYVPLRGQDDG